MEQPQRGLLADRSGPPLRRLGHGEPRLNHDSYEAGTVPLTDLLDAQTQLRLARDRYTEACTAYCNARTAYRQAVGEQGDRIVPELSQFLCRRI